MDRVHCAACGADTPREFVSLPFARISGSPWQSPLGISYCATCGMLYQPHPPTAARLARYYARCAKYAGDPAPVGVSDEIRALAGEISRRVGPRGRVCEIGCGRGELVRELAARGLRVTAVDASPRLVRRLRAERIEAVCATLEQIIPLGAFDSFVLRHVLEHLRDPVGALWRLRRMLTPRGIMYIEVPDAVRYQSGVHGPYQWASPEHLWHWTPVTLRSTLARAGLGGDLTLTGVQLSDYHRTGAIGVFAERLTGGVTSGTDFPTQAPGLYQLHELVERIPDGRWALWGAGWYAAVVLGHTRRLPSLIVDGNHTLQGRTLAHCVIQPPNALRAWRGPIVVGSAIYSLSIQNEAAVLGVADRMVFLQDRRD